MSVYIKGMNKPKDCWMCNFVDRDYGNCLVDGKEHGDYNKPEDCPLMDITEVNLGVFIEGKVKTFDIPKPKEEQA